MVCCCYNAYTENSTTLIPNPSTMSMIIKIFIRKRNNQSMG